MLVAPHIHAQAAQENAARDTIARVRVPVETVSAAARMSVPVAVANVEVLMNAQARVPEAEANVVRLMSVPVAAASVAAHMSVPAREQAAMESVVARTNAPAEEANAVALMNVPARALRAEASADRPMSAPVAVASVEVHTNVPAVEVSVAVHTNALAEEANAAHPMTVQVHNQCAMNIVRPSLSPYVQKIERGNRIIYINPNIPRWVVTDACGDLVMSLFDGASTIDEIIETAVSGLGEEQRNRVTSFCDLVMNSGLMDHVPPGNNPKKHRYCLSSVHLSLSDSCNLNCAYCYARERVEKKHPKLIYEEYTKIIDDVLEISRGVTFTLTGGEPLLNRDCLRIAEYIKSKGAGCYLLSNGILIDDSNIKRISELFDLVTLSIDGPNPEIHARTRGHNYDRVIRATDLLQAHGVEYTLSMTVTKDNIAYVEEMARKFGSRLNFAPYFPVSGDPSALAITGEEYYNALKSSAGVRPLSYCEGTLDASLHTQCHKCAIGDGEFSISASGDVYPCQLLHTDEFYAGNVHEESITDIYYKSASIARCASLDVDIMEGCKDCPIKYICGGSCRARSFYEGGRIDASSAFCTYELNAFLDGILEIYSRNAV